MLLILLACTGAPDSGAPPVDTAAEWPCPGEPVITYTTWGEGFLAAYCDSCHSATAIERHDAPESVTFDTEAELRDHAAGVRARVLDASEMPPGGGITADDLTRLEILLRCGL